MFTGQVNEQPKKKKMRWGLVIYTIAQVCTPLLSGFTPLLNGYQTKIRNSAN